MKQAIEHLLESIEAGASPKGIEPHARKVRVALDAGAFDCLDILPGSTPPENNRDVLARTCGAVRPVVAYYHHRDKCWLSSETCNGLREVVSWQELPGGTK